MVAVLKVVDEHFGACAPARRAGPDLRLVSERVTLREIIRARVAAEVEEINQRQARKALTRSYLIPTDPNSLEAKLNSTSARILDIEQEVGRAVAAFMRRKFIVLLDDRQIDDLDETVGLRPESEVVFVHLTPLKGG